MSEIFRGRYTAQIEGPFVVFIIGMRINRWSALHKWLPVFKAMRPMVEELLAEPELGMLHFEVYRYWRGAHLTQYWRSFEQLERYARSPAGKHLEAWKQFNRAVGADGSVGIWHETYLLQAGQYECIYGNMPRIGLAMAGSHMAAKGARETAKRRMGMQGEPAVASYDNPA